MSYIMLAADKLQLDGTVSARSFCFLYSVYIYYIKGDKS